MKAINVGENIKRIRVNNRSDDFSVKYVVDEMNKLGYELSNDTYYRWENGKTKVPCDALPYLSKVLCVSEFTILHYGYDNYSHDQNRFLAAINNFSDRQKNILDWILNKWIGNSLLILAITAMCLSLSDKNRLYIIMGIKNLYEQDLSTGKTAKDCPDINMRYVEESIKKLERQVHKNPR